jgi:hypothetical protein
VHIKNSKVHIKLAFYAGIEVGHIGRR